MSASYTRIISTTKLKNEWICPQNFRASTKKANFEKPLANIKNELKQGKWKFFKLSMWLGSMVELKKLLGKCLLDWDDTRANGCRVKIVYTQMHVLRTANNIILAEVPTDVDAACLIKMLWQTMEEAQKKMVAKNPAKYGALLATPKFSM